eukprot:Skav218581  [mRNA]  locus=scaffold2610:492381:493388:+ [translate_table: standard]
MWQDSHVPTQIAEQLRKEHSIVACWNHLHTKVLVRKPVYLYIFSGRRRDGDYQHFVECFLSKYAEEGQILLVDLALSKLHDVTDNTLLSQFLEWYRCGFVAAMLVAPPCETWSQARHNPVPLPNAPRPIRSSACPFGLDALSRAELDQISVSSLLLFTAIRLFFGAIVYQIPATMEHPKMPSKKERASIWFLPWIQRFLTHSEVQLVALNQAEFGAGSVKPTNFLLCCQSGFWGVIQKHRSPVDWHRLDVLAGVDAKGCWKTASGKEYPQALNAALAESHVASVSSQRVVVEVRSVVPDHQSFFDTIYAGDEDYSHQTLQPDYAKLAYRDLDCLD